MRLGQPYHPRRDLQRPKAVSTVRTVPISKSGGEKSTAKRVTVDAESK